MYGCQQNLISPDKELKAVLEFLCSEASKLINCGTYYARQLFFKTGRIPSRAKLHKVLGTDNRNIHYKAFYSDTAQQILTSVAESFQSLMSGKNNGFWSKRLERLTESRNRTMRDAVNKAARKVINHCVSSKIGTVIFGWNNNQKDSINLGTKTNQKFVQIPTGRLKARIAQLCEQYGIKFVETEESYTSKTSFLDADKLPKFGEKPEGWKASGTRIKRGLYRTAKGWLINADCNGCANIGRKVATMLGLDLSGVGRGDLSAPVRLKLWSYESPRL
jgi:IS605 OrfB family transposase